MLLRGDFESIHEHKHSHDFWINQINQKLGWLQTQMQPRQHQHQQIPTSELVFVVDLDWAGVALNFGLWRFEAATCKLQNRLPFKRVPVSMAHSLSSWDSRVCPLFAALPSRNTIAPIHWIERDLYHTRIPSSNASDTFGGSPEMKVFFLEFISRVLFANWNNYLDLDSEEFLQTVDRKRPPPLASSPLQWQMQMQIRCSFPMAKNCHLQK